MLPATAGNQLDAPADALVNTVNCEGVMGNGIALFLQWVVTRPPLAEARERRGW